MRVRLATQGRKNSNAACIPSDTNRKEEPMTGAGEAANFIFTNNKVPENAAWSSVWVKLLRK
jgi:hypothetical protein